MKDGDVGRLLSRMEVPGELQARQRSWGVVREAFGQRERVGGRRRRAWPVVALACAALVAAAVASPPGRAVLGEVRDALGRDRIVRNAQPSLFSLPTRGRLLAQSSRGPWIIRPDGAKRLLGTYREASWSPFGQFVVASRENELVALQPDGRIRWSLAQPDVRHPRWGGTKTDTRIAYLSEGALRVVAGDSTGDHVLVERTADVAPAWKRGGDHVLAYVTPAGFVRVVDADSGDITAGWREGRPEQLVFSADGTLIAARGARLLSIYTEHGFRRVGITGPHGRQGTLGLGTDRFLDVAFAPHEPTLAYVLYDPASDGSTVWTVRRGGEATPQQVFKGVGRMTDVEWSPDGRWLLVAWEFSDQWVFIQPAAGPAKIVARSSITAQLNRGSSEAPFPTIAGWCCP